jgi:2-dehydro-3-deoxyphosphogluconate aldolase/(4S)-4-hydroxy-2-oxoglutarate aldolase
VDERALALRASATASLIRDRRLIAVLRRVTPRSALLAVVDELADAGVAAVEITLDAPSAAADLEACRSHLERRGPAVPIVGAGTVRSEAQLEAAAAAGAAFIVSPVFDPAIVDGALAHRLVVMPGAYTPTEVDRAWRAGATFVKLFPASSLGPAHVRELRGPFPEVELIPTGGIDASNARTFLEAGAVAVGVGSALVRARPSERRAIVEAAAR